MDLSWLLENVILKLLLNFNSLLFLTRYQVLLKSCRMEENADAFVLLEDVQKSWDPREVEKGGGGSQRILDRDEKVLQAQSKWRGSGRFIVRKSGSVRTHLHRLSSPFIFFFVTLALRLQMSRPSVLAIRPSKGQSSHLSTLKKNLPCSKL